MSTAPRRDTAPELALRRELHRRGFRYLVDAPLPGLGRRRADLLFRRERVAVFVDGCFWHGCPLHSVVPKANRDWWIEKVAANRARDEDTNRHLDELGWVVFRAWEHDCAVDSADAVAAVVLGRRRAVAER